jgi:hypothetical protein
MEFCCCQFLVNIVIAMISLFVDINMFIQIRNKAKKYYSNVYAIVK